MEVKLELLIIEDNLKHFADAREICQQYRGIEFTFASTLNDVSRLLKNNTYGAVISDVFFPDKIGDEPDYHCGVAVAMLLLEDTKTPFVYNTAGNHHGRLYQQFLDALKHQLRANNIYKSDSWACRSSGKLIEAYPEDNEGEKDTKQWVAAINYAILLAKSKEVNNDVSRNIGVFLEFAHHGDYGRLTEQMDGVLDQNISVEEYCKKILPHRNMLLSKNYDPMYFRTFEFIRTTIAAYKYG